MKKLNAAIAGTIFLMILNIFVLGYCAKQLLPNITETTAETTAETIPTSIETSTEELSQKTEEDKPQEAPPQEELPVEEPENIQPVTDKAEDVPKDMYRPTQDAYLISCEDSDMVIIDDETSLSTEGNYLDIDLNADGLPEKLILRKDEYGKLNIIGVDGEGWGEVFETNLTEDFKNCSGIDANGNLKPNCMVQITCYDFEYDGTQEVIIAIGDKATFQQTNVYTYRPLAGGVPGFSHVGTIVGSNMVYVRGKSEIVSLTQDWTEDSVYTYKDTTYDN